MSQLSFFHQSTGLPTLKFKARYFSSTAKSKSSVDFIHAAANVPLDSASVPGLIAGIKYAMSLGFFAKTGIILLGSVSALVAYRVYESGGQDPYPHLYVLAYILNMASSSVIALYKGLGDNIEHMTQAQLTWHIYEGKYSTMLLDWVICQIRDFIHGLEPGSYLLESYLKVYLPLIKQHNTIMRFISDAQFELRIPYLDTDVMPEDIVQIAFHVYGFNPDFFWL